MHYKQYVLVIKIKINMERKSTKEKLIIEAFKLFASKPYDQVTFADLQVAMNLSRGAVMYHVGVKEQLFEKVVEYFIFHTTSAASISIDDNMTLRKFIKGCINLCAEEVENFKNIGISNINKAKLNIESQGFYFYKDMEQQGIKWFESQYKAWEQVIQKAMLNNEITSDIPSSDIASLFINQYLGVSYAGLTRENGIDLGKLENDLMLIYNLLKIKV